MNLGFTFPPPFREGTDSMGKYYSDDPNAIVQLNFEQLQRWQTRLGSWREALTFVDTVGAGADRVQTYSDPPSPDAAGTWFDREVGSVSMGYLFDQSVGTDANSLVAQLSISLNAGVSDGESFWPKIDINGNGVAVTLPPPIGPQFYFHVGFSNIETDPIRTTPTWTFLINAVIDDGTGDLMASIPLYAQPLSDFGVTTADLETFYVLTALEAKPTAYVTS